MELCFLATFGKGHVASLALSDLKYCLIWSYKYHCRSGSIPVPSIMGGITPGVIITPFLRSENFSSWVLTKRLQMTTPGSLADTRKLWKLVMFFRGLNKTHKNDVQSKNTTGLLGLSATWATLWPFLEDSFTLLATSW